MTKNNWTYEETVIAFNVYCKIPFKNSSKNHPIIIQYAKLLGRTPSALNMKIGNLGRLDPNLKEKGIVGLSHGSQIEQKVWDEFYDNPEKLAFESEEQIALLNHKTIEEFSEIDISDISKPTEREVIIKQRVNQSFFRSTVLSSYDCKCCISGIGSTSLLDACHIVDWASDTKNRLNPTNGICLNTLFHKAYDNHYIGITPDYKICISDSFLEECDSDTTKLFLEKLKGEKIMLPDKFLPNKDFLEIHYEQYKHNK